MNDYVKTLEKDPCGCEIRGYRNSKWNVPCIRHAKENDMDVVSFEETPAAWEQLIEEWEDKKLKLQKKIARYDEKIKDAESAAKKLKMSGEFDESDQSSDSEGSE